MTFPSERSLGDRLAFTALMRPPRPARGSQSGVGQEDGNPDASARPPIDAAMDEWTQRAFQPPTGDPESERRRVLHFTNVLFGEGGFRCVGCHGSERHTKRARLGY